MNSRTSKRVSNERLLVRIEKGSLAYLAFGDGLLDFFDLDFAEAFDFEKSLARCRMDRLVGSVCV